MENYRMPAVTDKERRLTADDQVLIAERRYRDRRSVSYFLMGVAFLAMPSVFSPIPISLVPFAILMIALLSWPHRKRKR